MMIICVLFIRVRTTRNHSSAGGVVVKHMLSNMPEHLSKLWRNDYVLLTKFIAPLIFTNLVVDVGEQVRQCSIGFSNYTS